MIVLWLWYLTIPEVHCRVKLYYDNWNSREKIELQKDLKICPLSKSRMLISSMPRVNGVLCLILMPIYMFDNLSDGKDF